MNRGMNLGRRLGRVGVFGQAVVFVLFVRNLSAGLLERELTRLEAALRFPRGASRAIGDLVAGSGLGRRLRERSSSSQNDAPKSVSFALSKSSRCRYSEGPAEASSPG